MDLRLKSVRIGVDLPEAAEAFKAKDLCVEENSEMKEYEGYFERFSSSFRGKVELSDWLWLVPKASLETGATIDYRWPRHEQNKSGTSAE